MTNQPNPLPKTLPAGTRTQGGSIAIGELKLEGENSWAAYRGVWDSSMHGAGYVGTCGACGIDWSSITPPVEDRPIQAGDWVECVGADSTTDPFLTQGARYLVLAPGKWLKLDGVPEAWKLARFKRVDGPHPVEPANPAEELCASCEQPAGYCAENCAVRPRECDSCHAPATKFEDTTGLRISLCVYCFDSTGGGRSGRKLTDMGWALDSTNLAARARNDAALRREAERPRGNRAERKSLAAGHPASWPSNEGED